MFATQLARPDRHIVKVAPLPPSHSLFLSPPCSLSSPNDARYVSRKVTAAKGGLGRKDKTWIRHESSASRVNRSMELLNAGRHGPSIHVSRWSGLWDRCKGFVRCKTHCRHSDIYGRLQSKARLATVRRIPSPPATPSGRVSPRFLAFRYVWLRSTSSTY